MKKVALLLSILVLLSGCAIPVVQRDPKLPLMGAKLTASVNITSSPSGAGVYVNGNYMGETQTSITVDAYQTFWEANTTGGWWGNWYSRDRVVVKKDGYLSQGKEINSETVTRRGDPPFRLESMSMHFTLQKAG